MQREHKTLELGKITAGEITDSCLSIVMIMFPSKYFRNWERDLVDRSQGSPAICTESYITQIFLAISQLST